MKINSNINALFTGRNLKASTNNLQNTMQRLSSGLRINSAKDDAAGLAISNRFTSRINGMEQASRNTNDAISMLQTAEGALSTVTDSLQRIRTLAVQAANGTNSLADKQSLQAEVQQLKDEIRKLYDRTNFNGVQLFDRGEATRDSNENETSVINGLHSYWLEQSENIIEKYYGLKGDNAILRVDIKSFSDGLSNTAARVVGTIQSGETLVSNQVMEIDMADFTPPNLPNGGKAPFYNDRIIAHEMVHAVMGRTINATDAGTPKWFKEGSAEFIHGADERLSNDIDLSNVATVVNRIGDGSSAAWGNQSIDYSTAYAAVRYMHAEIKANGGDGIKDIMTYLAEDPNRTLDQAFAEVSSGAFTDLADFVADYKANGANFISTKMDLNNADTGAIGGLDADNGDLKTADNVVPTPEFYETDPLQGFITAFNQSVEIDRHEINLQLGENSSQKFKLESVSRIDVEAFDVANDAEGTIRRVDAALKEIDSHRAMFGAIQNRLESTVNNLANNIENTTASRSRLLDADFASETTKMTRAQILQQAGIAMMAQANSSSQLALQLL
jgi:flagellin